MPTNVMQQKKALKDDNSRLEAFEKESGVTSEHILGILDVCAKRNVFLFLRPTEYATTLLIKEDYATKSMDIHHKSSNWGPMAGMVPVDPAFNKKCGVTDKDARPQEPKSQEELLAGGDHGPNAPHGASTIVQLELSDSLLQRLTKEGSLQLSNASMDTHSSAGTDHRVYKSTANLAPNAGKVLFHLKRKGNGEPWTVSWSKVQGDQTQHPLLVYAYETSTGPKPVTGDYDMWMVAPHMAWWKLHMHVLKVEDEHGGSAATLFNAWLIEELNVACKREGNPVFNHGAEQQNYGFTQVLDAKLAMFTPGKTYRMVDINDMPQVLAELMHAHYLVLWNKRYQELDPHIMGNSMSESQLRPFWMWKFWRDKMKRSNDSTDERVADFYQARALKESDGAVRIHKFYDNLEACLTKAGKPLLQPDDFGSFLHFHPDSLRLMQRQLQEKLVDATVKAGESDLNALESWYETNLDMLETMSAAFGPAPGELPQESAFLLRRNDEGGFMRRLPKPAWGGWKPDGIEWNAHWGIWQCCQCEMSAKLPNAKCDSHDAVLRQGKICCFKGHAIDTPSDTCHQTLCVLVRKEREAVAKQKAAIKKARPPGHH